ncbi:MAG: dihydropteroate synthase [Cytophagaceae bacterium]|nr:dihydropteroate synthase [Cytophagaceae bacterium]
MKNTINIIGKLLNLEDPLIMGIINVTPDSFYKDSRYNPFQEDFLEKAGQMIANGAGILDIGGYSTRPGAEEVNINEEIKRVTKAIDIIHSNFPKIPISIDTFRSEVAREAIDAGASIVNDVSGGALDGKMFDFIISKNLPYILMHSRGNPQNMASMTTYGELYSEILSELFSKANQLRKSGVKDIIIDPGFGFAKNQQQNFQLLQHLEIFQNENYPVLIGISRKSMIYKLLNITAEETLNSTSALHMLALIKKTKILRVHDVKEAFQVKKLFKNLF